MTLPDDYAAATTQNTANQTPAGEITAVADITHTAYSDWRRVHPLSPLVGAGSFIVVIIFYILFNFRSAIFDPGFYAELEFLARQTESSGIPAAVEIAAASGLLTVILGILCVLILTLLMMYLEWRAKQFRITGENFQLKQGIIFRKQQLAPLRRIQGVEIERSLLARLAGLSSLRINTVSSNFALSFLRRAEAEELRHELLHLAAITQGKPVQNVATVLPAAGEQPATVHTAPAPTTTAGETTGNDATRPYPAGAAETLHDTATANTIRVPLYRVFLGSLWSWGSIFLAIISGVVIGCAIGFKTPELLLVFFPALLGWVLALFKFINNSFNFHLTVRDGDLLISYGLLKTVTQTVPLQRIVSLKVAQPWLWRVCGWYRVEYANASLPVADVNQQQLSRIALPVGTAEQMEQVLQMVFIENTRETPERVRELLRFGSPLTYQTQRRAAPLLVLSAKNQGAEIIGDTPQNKIFMNRYGLFTNTAVLSPLARLQGVKYRIGPGHAAFRLAGVEVIKAGMPLRSSVRGLNRATARELFSHLSRASLTATQSDTPATTAADEW